MWQTRLLFLAATLFGDRLHVAGQQIPDCTRRCITINATPGCDIKNIGCLCRTQSSHAAVPQCIFSICASSGAQTAISAFDNLCIAAVCRGNTNTTSPAPPPQDSPTSSPPSLPSSPSTSQPPVPPRSTSRSTDAGQSSPSFSSSISTSTLPSDDHVTVPSGSTSPSQSQSSTAVGAAPSDSTAQDADTRSFSSGGLVGSIIGGLGGGLLVVAIVGCFLWRRHKRSAGFESIEISHLSSTSSASNTIRPIVLGGSALKTHKRLDSGSSGYPLRYRDSPDPYLSPIAPGDDVAAAALAVRPLVLDTSGRTYPRRKGDPPPLPPVLGPGPSSPFTDVQSSVSTDHLSPGRTESPAVHVPSADLTPSQLDIVQTMVNRGVHGSAVVDVIQRMIADNATPAPPEYEYADSPAR
ncbi:hypothetical protein EXIGLDRAFT_724551 [Exidia glandulosa HHB12029]|uniref:CFEM domain-containing protein n=1 Tax=Exidia glandulosa HHB12029 TaxID=1314781 RepID=A0A165ECL8_EXIGL|nr:hypothetical protein EXIGLDRAFT_724551 [Exidia glandulosa HHB12029]